MSNVLVYSGPGVSSSALSHTLRTLRRLLPTYDVQCINAQSLALDPWMESTSLFVLPGGRDLPYVDKLAEAHTGTTSTSPSLATRRTADQRIREFVQHHGGAFVGICAGAYFASARCEFEEHDPVMRVVGPRPALEFYPGVCRGTAFPGFVYESDHGARMVDVEMQSQTGEQQRKLWSTYYNGGGAFIDADTFAGNGVQVLARYSEHTEQGGLRPNFAGQAAIVHCTVGRGKAILYGTHPEFPVFKYEKSPQTDGAPQEESKGADPLVALELERLYNFGRHLQSLGLEVELPTLPQAGQTNKEVQPSSTLLTPLVLHSRDRLQANMILDTLQSIAIAGGASQAFHINGTPSEGRLLSISDTNDTIHFYNASSSPSLASACAQADYSPYMAPVVAPTSDEARAGSKQEPEMEVDLQKVPKYIVVCRDAADLDALDHRLTPHWNIVDFTHSIDRSRALIESSVTEKWVAVERSSFAREQEQVTRLADVHTSAVVVTSTQTMLDKNYGLCTRLPSGFTSFATHQVSGRGRGKNAWISPLGCLQFSTLIRIPSPSKAFWHSGMGAIVFVQYLAGLAIVESVRSGALGKEYADALGDKLRIKWPNDVYAEVDEEDKEGQENARKGTFVWRGKRYAKMAGVLVNSQFAGTELALVVGCGINTLNARPTTSLSDLIEAYNARRSSSSANEAPLPTVSQERFAGAILATFERMWNVFTGSGGNFAPFVEAYRRAWLHSDQETLLTDTVPPTRARIVGITSDYGLLRCSPLDGAGHSSVDTFTPAAWGPSGAPGGQWIDLQPDGNSFDMLQNLIRRKE